MKKLVLLGLAAGLVSGAATMTFAADPSEKPVAARRGYMQMVSFNAGPLFGVLKGQVPYDAKTAKTLADNLKLLSQMENIDAMFPKGSDTSNPALKGKTTAIAAIWAPDSKFKNQWADWRKAVAELAAVAGSGKDAMVAKMKVVGGTCAACHKANREKK